MLLNLVNAFFLQVRIIIPESLGFLGTMTGELRIIGELEGSVPITVRLGYYLN